MQEQAQLAKLRRNIFGALAKMGGAGFLGLLPLSPAENAALALRKFQIEAPDHTTTTFAIPLVGAHQVSDWDVIEDTLARSLNALIAQTDPNWRAIVCSQTRPNAVDLDPRISHLPFEVEIAGHDKVAKLQTLAQHCLLDHPKPGFFMPLDGDDLLERNFTQGLHKTPRNGLLVCGGYIVNSTTGHVGVTRNRSWRAPLQKPFWKFCGSCMALPVGNAPAAESTFFKALAEHEHRLYPYLATLAGNRLIHLDKASALYVINHGENFETRRGRGGFKQRFIERFLVSQESELSEIQSAFPGSGELINPHKGDL
jgi:hypothetical protein